MRPSAGSGARPRLRTARTALLAAAILVVHLILTLAASYGVLVSALHGSGALPDWAEAFACAGLCVLAFPVLLFGFLAGVSAALPALALL